MKIRIKLALLHKGDILGDEELDLKSFEGKARIRRFSAICESSEGELLEISIEDFIRNSKNENPLTFQTTLLESKNKRERYDLKILEYFKVFSKRNSIENFENLKKFQRIFEEKSKEKIENVKKIIEENSKEKLESVKKFKRIFEEKPKEKCKNTINEEKLREELESERKFIEKKSKEKEENVKKFIEENFENVKEFKGIIEEKKIEKLENSKKLKGILNTKGDLMENVNKIRQNMNNFLKKQEELKQCKKIKNLRVFEKLNEIEEFYENVEKKKTMGSLYNSQMIEDLKEKFNRIEKEASRNNSLCIPLTNDPLLLKNINFFSPKYTRIHKKIDKSNK